MVSKVINLEEYLMSTQEENYIPSHLYEGGYQQPRGAESPELHKLFEALAKAQMEMDVAKQESKNPYFNSRYADLRSVVDASRPFLSKNGLCVIQRTLPGKNGETYLHTRLGHLSGQWMESYMVVRPAKQDVQSLGSYLTYLRRYSYSSIVGVVTGGEDDDGEKAMAASREPSQERETISRPQLEVLADELKGEEVLVEQILKSYGISKLSDIPKENYTRCLQKIREIKKSREQKPQ